MLTFILIGGLVWLAVAMVFVLALAAAARKQVSPVAVNSPLESHEHEISATSAPQVASSPSRHSAPLGQPVTT